LHPSANERNELAPEEKTIIAMSERAECVPPSDSANGHPARPAADIFRDARCFNFCHVLLTRSRRTIRRHEAGTVHLFAEAFNLRHDWK